MSKGKSINCRQLIAKMEITVFVSCVAWAMLLTVLGTMNLLPLKINWPVGYTSKALQIGNHYAVPVEFVSRVQLYDNKLNFKKSVWVNAHGGSFELFPHDESSFWIYTARGDHKIRVNLSGEKIQQEKYEQLPAIEANYEWLNIPASPFLLAISNFGYLWSIGMVCAIIAFFTTRNGKKRH